MSEILNSYEVTGPSADVAALLARADLRAGGFFRSLVAEPFDDDAVVRELHDVEPPVTFPGDGYDGASFTVVSKGESPMHAARLAADANPSLTFRLATVDLGNEVASMVVLRGVDRWDMDLDGVDWEALAARAEDGENPEGDLLDRLFAESESVADDYRNAAPAPKA